MSGEPCGLHEAIHALLESDAMTANDDGTPSGYYVDVENVEHLVRTVLEAADSARAEDQVVLHEWGIRWDERWPGLHDVSGPYATAAQARDGLDRSAYPGRVVWRTKTATAWRDWPTTQPRTPAGSTEEATS